MGKKIKSKKIPNESLIINTKSLKGIKTAEPFNGNIHFKLDNINFKSIKSADGFTNYLRDIFEAHSYFVLLFDKFLKHMKDKKIGEIHKENHYHRIDGKKERICREIVKKIRNQKEVSEDAEFYQFGIEGLRIITQKIDNVYDVLFLDPHHLLYSNKNYNQSDYNNYNCCMINLNDKSNNIKNKLEEQKNKIQELEKKVKILEEKLNQQK